MFGESHLRHTCLSNMANPTEKVLIEREKVLIERENVLIGREKVLIERKKVLIERKKVLIERSTFWKLNRLFVTLQKAQIFRVNLSKKILETTCADLRI